MAETPIKAPRQALHGSSAVYQDRTVPSISTHERPAPSDDILHLLGVQQQNRSSLTTRAPLIAEFSTRNGRKQTGIQIQVFSCRSRKRCYSATSPPTWGIPRVEPEAMSPAFVAVEPYPLRNQSGGEQLFPKRTACCSHGCKPVVMWITALTKPRDSCRPFRTNDLARP